MNRIPHAASLELFVSLIEAVFPLALATPPAEALGGRLRADGARELVAVLRRGVERDLPPRRRLVHDAPTERRRSRVRATARRARADGRRQRERRRIARR